MTVLAYTAWPTNAAMIAEVATLGYLDKDWLTLDATYGLGNFWTEFRPNRLVAHDLITDGVDFRHLPEGNESFDVVVFDPPYKLNGTPNEATDKPYGVHVAATRQDRHHLIKTGMAECVRVLKVGGFLLLKCQDQVSSGKVRWQTMEFSLEAEEILGLELIDRFDMIGGRPQPAGRRQVHARRNASTLLVFRKVWR